MAIITQTEAAYYADGNSANFGNYQFVSLANIIKAFNVVYVGEGKLIDKASKTDIAFHAQRALAEMSFDTFKSIKALEITVPNTLTMTLPIDYVNYTKICYIDSAGMQHPLYPTRHTSNPTNPTQTGSIGNENFIDAGGDGNIDLESESDAWSRYKSATPNENENQDYDYDDNIYDANIGQRYGLDPAFAQVNGSYYIDENKGFIHFSSNMSGQIIILEYISDSLGTEDEMKVHKFAEEAMYKQITYAILSNKVNTPQGLVMRLKKEARAAKRNTKLRLSNVKMSEIIQSLRGKSKQIKH